MQPWLAPDVQRRLVPVEPEGNDTRFESPLIRFDNVILTPHIGGSTGEAHPAMRSICAWLQAS